MLTLIRDERLKKLRPLLTREGLPAWRHKGICAEVKALEEMKVAPDEAPKTFSSQEQ